MNHAGHIFFSSQVAENVFEKIGRFRHLAGADIVAGEKAVCRINDLEAVMGEFLEIVLRNRIFVHEAAESRAKSVQPEKAAQTVRTGNAGNSDKGAKAAADAGAARTEKTEKKEHEPCFSAEDVARAVSGFSGEIQQVPPMYSALKVDGKRLYKYAREGQEIAVKPRKIIINDLTVEEIENNEITFTVECSKGTYIRSICRDIGDALGCGGAMASLTRLRSGVFDIRDSLTLEELEQMRPDEIFASMKEPDYPLTHFGHEEAVRAALKKAPAVLIDGEGVLCTGVNGDATAVSMLVRKNCIAYFAAASLGKARKLSTRDAVFMVWSNPISLFSS